MTKTGSARQLLVQQPRALGHIKGSREACYVSSMNPTSRVRDVAPLRDGRVLVSLGGSVRLYTPGGAPSVQFSCQAETLVCSSDGRRAIAVSGVSRLRQLARLDLHEGIARPWCEVEIEVFARTFEGRLWYVATEGSPVMGIDTEAPGFEIATRGEEETFWPVFLRPLPDQLYLMSTSLGAEHVQLYQLPSLALVGGSLVPKPRQHPDDLSPECREARRRPHRAGAARRLGFLRAGRDLQSGGAATRDGAPRVGWGS